MDIQLTPVSLLIGFVIQVWLVVIFPVLVLKKLNLLISLVEAQFESEEEDFSGQDEA